MVQAESNAGQQAERNRLCALQIAPFRFVVCGEKDIVLRLAVCFQLTDTSKFVMVHSPFWIKLTSLPIAGLHPRSPRHFALQPSTRVSQTLWPTNINCYITCEYWHLHHCDCRHILMFAHCPDLCDISLATLYPQLKLETVELLLILPGHHWFCDWFP